MTEHHRENNGQAHNHERASDPVLAEILTAVRETSKTVSTIKLDVALTRESVQRLDTRLDAQEKASEKTSGILSSHMINEEAVMKDTQISLENLREAVAEIHRGFPRHPKSGERDPGYHADWHEDDIDKSRDKKEFMKKLRDWVVFGALGVLLTGVGALLISGTKVEIKRVAAEEVKK